MPNIGNREMLIEKVKHQKSIWMNKNLSEFFRTNGCLLVRAINFGELRQLVKDGPENFLFHKGINFEFEYGRHIESYATYRSGTVIVVSLKEEDILIDGEEKDHNKTKKIRYMGGGRAFCLRDFRTSVELYNISEFNWNQLSNPKNTEIMDCDSYL